MLITDIVTKELVCKEEKSDILLRNYVGTGIFARLIKMRGSHRNIRNA